MPAPNLYPCLPEQGWHYRCPTSRGLPTTMWQKINMIQLCLIKWLFRCRRNAVCTFRHILNWLRGKQLWLFTWSMSFYSSLLGAYSIWTGTLTWRVERVTEIVHQGAMAGWPQLQGTPRCVASIDNGMQSCRLQRCQEVKIKAISGKEGLVDETYLQQF